MMKTSIFNDKTNIFFMIKIFLQKAAFALPKFPKSTEQVSFIKRELLLHKKQGYEI